MPTEKKSIDARLATIAESQIKSNSSISDIRSGMARRRNSVVLVVLDAILRRERERERQRQRQPTRQRQTDREKVKRQTERQTEREML